jgi:hypothetical protein
MLNQNVGDLLHTIERTELSHVRAKLLQLLIIPSIAPHRTANFRAIATLAISLLRRILRCAYCRCHCSSQRATLCADWPSKKRSSLLPCFVM